MEGKFVAVVAVALAAGLVLHHHHQPHFVHTAAWDCDNCYEQDSLRLHKQAIKEKMRQAKTEITTQKALLREELRANARELRSTVRDGRNEFRDSFRQTAFAGRDEARARAEEIKSEMRDRQNELR